MPRSNQLDKKTETFTEESSLINNDVTISTDEIDYSEIEHPLLRTYCNNHYLSGCYNGACGCFIGITFATGFHYSGFDGFDFTPTIASALGGLYATGMTAWCAHCLYPAEGNWLNTIISSVGVVGGTAGTFISSLIVPNDANNLIKFAGYTLGVASGSLLSIFGLFGVDYARQHYVKENV